MTVSETRLPSAFAEFEPFAEKWCLATEPERWNARLATPMPEIREFYDAFTPRFEEAIEYCDKFPSTMYQTTRSTCCTSSIP